MSIYTLYFYDKITNTYINKHLFILQYVVQGDPGCHAPWLGLLSVASGRYVLKRKGAKTYDPVTPTKVRDHQCHTEVVTR